MANKQRSVAEIERDLDTTTQRLANEVDELAQRLRPSRMVHAGVDDVKRSLGSSGARRAEVIGAIAGAVVIGLVMWRVSKR